MGGSRLVKVSNDVSPNGGVADGGGTLGNNTTHAGTPIYVVQCLHAPIFTCVAGTQTLNVVVQTIQKMCLLLSKKTSQ